MKFVLTSAILLLSFALIGCDSNDLEDDGLDEINDVVILPDSAGIELGDEADFSFAALTVAGDTVPASELDVGWWSTDTTVFTVDDSGLATARDTGKAFCVVEVADVAKTARFVGRDSATVVVYMF